MLSKIKKYFFTGVFFILYVSFVAQFIYVISMFFTKSDMFGGHSSAFFALGLLSIQWLVLISARYLSKKSSNSASRGNENQFYNNRRR
jgi:hypothetical protein